MQGSSSCKVPSSVEAEILVKRRFPLDRLQKFDQHFICRIMPEDLSV
jgi:hypothetical protein